MEKRNRNVSEDYKVTRKINKIDDDIDNSEIYNGEYKIQVVIRVRPAVVRELENKSFNQCLTVKDNKVYITKSNKTLSIQDKAFYNDLLSCYYFDKVFDQSTKQTEIFENVGMRCIKSFLSGYNTTIFAYGQTGSGKTFTIQGSNDYVNQGIVPNIINYLCNYLDNNKSNLDNNSKESFSLSAVQIYMEKANDLLVENNNKNQIEYLKVVENCEKSDKETYKKSFECKNLTSTNFTTKDKGMKLFSLACNNRVTRETMMNEASSRGHIIYTIKHIKEKTVNGKLIKIASKLNIVDLAGSERVYKSGVTGARLKEANSVNSSLLCLLRVVEALTNKNSVYRNAVPYRDSILTKLLADSIGGNCVTSLIATLSPSLSEASESISTLNFATSCGKIVNSAIINSEKEIREVEEKIYGISRQAIKEEIEKNRPTIVEVPWKNMKPEYDYKITSLNIAGQQLNIGYIESSFYLENSEVFILLHASPSSCEEFYHWFPGLNYYNIRVIAIDQPGYGRSGGKTFPCNSKFHLDKGGPCDVVLAFMEKMNIKKAYVGGYDWGAGIALTLIMKYPGIFKRAVVLCASYNEPTGNELKCIVNPVLILWEKLDQFHPWSKWSALANKIPNKKIELLGLKKYTPECSWSTYAVCSDKIIRSVVMFLGFPDPTAPSQELKEKIEQKQTDVYGNDIKANMLINFNDSETLRNELKGKDLNNLFTEEEINAVNDFISYLNTYGSKQLYDKLTKNENVIKSIVRNLPVIHPKAVSLNPGIFIQLGIWNKLPDNIDCLFNSPFLKEGQEILALISCSNKRESLESVLNQKSDFLLYNEKCVGKYLSPFCSISKIDYSKEIVTVKVKNTNLEYTDLEFKLNDILKWNGPQDFYYDSNSYVYLEDGLRGNYSNGLVKAKIIEIAFNIKKIVESFDYKSHEQDIINKQIECILTLRRTLDIESFYEGVDKNRYGRTDCLGKLGVYGQAQCHGFSSAISGYLLPFSSILGIELLYRGGNSYTNKKDETIIVNNEIENHQWLQVMLRPSNKYYCVDGWYHSTLKSEKYLKMPLLEAILSMTYPHPAIKLKNCIKSN